MAQLVRAPARGAGDPGSNPGPDINYSLKLLIFHHLVLSLFLALFFFDTRSK